MRRARLACVVAVTLAAAPAAAGDASFQITEAVFNAGGHPTDGLALASSSFRITLGAIGDAVSGGLMCSTQFCIDSGSIAPLRPPGSVKNLRFTMPDELTWDPVGLADVYNLYRGEIATLPGGYGACLADGLAGTTTPVPEDPAEPGQGFFYLVTAVSSVGGEGSKGTDGSGNARANPAPCS